MKGAPLDAPLDTPTRCLLYLGDVVQSSAQKVITYHRAVLYRCCSLPCHTPADIQIQQI